MDDAHALARDIGDRRVEAKALAVRASVWHRLGNEDAAADGYHRALFLAQTIGNRHVETESLIGLAQVHQQAGHPDQAREYADAASAIADQVGFRLLAERAKAVRLVAHPVVLGRRVRDDEPGPTTRPPWASGP